MLHLASGRRFHVFYDTIPVPRVVRYLLQFAWAAVNTIVNAGRVYVEYNLFPFLDAKLAAVPANSFIVFAYEFCCGLDVTDVCRSDHNLMHEPAKLIYPDVALHPETPFIFFLRLIHLWIALLLRVLGERQRIDNGCVDHGPALEYMPRFHYNAVDSVENGLFRPCCSSRRLNYSNVVASGTFSSRKIIPTSFRMA